jgi:hypothetical protein
VPWSRPQRSSRRTGVGESNFWTRAARLGSPCRGVLQLIQLVRKAAEVVDRPWSSAHGNRRVFRYTSARTPRLSPWASAGSRRWLPTAVYKGCQQRIHRIPVTNEQRWHSAAHFGITLRYDAFCVWSGIKPFVSACLVGPHRGVRGFNQLGKARIAVKRP